MENGVGSCGGKNCWEEEGDGVELLEGRGKRKGVVMMWKKGLGFCALFI